MCGAISRAIACFNEKDKWLDIQREGMTHFVDWSSAAHKYLQIYKHLVEDEPIHATLN